VRSEIELQLFCGWEKFSLL